MGDSVQNNPLFISRPRIDSTSSEEVVEITPGSSRVGSFIGSTSLENLHSGLIPYQYSDEDFSSFEFSLPNEPKSNQPLLDTLDQLLDPIGISFDELKTTIEKANKRKLKKNFRKRAFKAIKHPRTTAKNSRELAINTLTKIPLVRQTVPAAKLLQHRRGKAVGDPEKIKEQWRKFANADFDLIERLGDRTVEGGQKIADWVSSGMSLAEFIGGGLSTQATAALSVVTVVGAALGLVVGVAGTVKTGRRLFATGKQGYNLHQMRNQAKELRRLSEFYEEWSRTSDGDQKEILSRYAELYREEAILLRDFAKSQRREVATQAVRGTLTMAANVSLIASGTSLILSASGVGAPVTVPLSVAFSGLSTGLMITSYGVGAGSWAIGKGEDFVRRKRAAKTPDISSTRGKWDSRWGGGVAKSRIGISTRAAMLVELEGELESISDDFLKPTAVKEWIFDPYVGDEITQTLLDNSHKRWEARETLRGESTEERKAYEKELYELANAFLETGEDSITRDEIVSALTEKVMQEPDNLIGTRKRSLWKKLAGGGAYRDWVANMSRDDFFDQGNYQLGEEAA